MSTKKDMRRPDLSEFHLFIEPAVAVAVAVAVADLSPKVIPYQLPAAKEASSDISGTLGSTMPMAAMFTRNKFIGWYVVLPC